ncbi:MAG: serine/threonine protein kinase [Gemmatimonadota bacterium]|nr:serine/threonine protein kinase [Gemmatimonadota bacterium]
MVAACTLVARFTIAALELDMAVPQLTIVPRAVPGRAELESALRGRYTILDALGGGAMSRVYAAREHALDRTVALKVLAEHHGSREDRERFRREARVLAMLRHPAIMPVYAAGDAAGIPYFVMPLIEGPSLARRIAAGPRFAEREACILLAALADAVAAAHPSGVIHRDIKPANVLLEHGRPILADFGIATVHTSEHSRSEVVRGFGTPAYMAPEQLLGDCDSDERSDIYSLGVVGFELLAGRPPFIGATEREIAAQHVGRPAPLVSVFRPDVASEVEQVIRRCLAKRPDDRWGTAAELRRAILDAAAPRPPRARRWASRLLGSRS